MRVKRPKKQNLSHIVPVKRGKGMLFNLKNIYPTKAYSFCSSFDALMWLHILTLKWKPKFLSYVYFILPHHPKTNFTVYEKHYNFHVHTLCRTHMICAIIPQNTCLSDLISSRELFLHTVNCCRYCFLTLFLTFSTFLAPLGVGIVLSTVVNQLYLQIGVCDFFLPWI